MTVPEALRELSEIHQSNPKPEVWRKKVLNVLESFWLQTYEEGLIGLFEAPADIPHGRHELQATIPTQRSGD